MATKTTRKPYAFSSTAQVVLDWWEAWKEADKAHHAALKKVAPKVAPWKGAKPAVIGAFGSYTFDGFHADGHPIPEGWRLIGKGRWVAPKKSTKEGKALAALMATVPRCTDPRFDPGIPGVKLDLLGGAPALGIHDGIAWMHWGEQWDRLDIIDQKIWTPRRLSEYYAAQEARIGGGQAGA